MLKDSRSHNRVKQDFDHWQKFSNGSRYKGKELEEKAAFHTWAPQNGVSEGSASAFVKDR